MWKEGVEWKEGVKGGGGWRACAQARGISVWSEEHEIKLNDNPEQEEPRERRASPLPMQDILAAAHYPLCAARPMQRPTCHARRARSEKSVPTTHAGHPCSHHPLHAARPAMQPSCSEVRHAAVMQQGQCSETHAGDAAASMHAARPMQPPLSSCSEAHAVQGAHLVKGGERRRQRLSRLPPRLLIPDLPKILQPSFSISRSLSGAV